MTQRRGRVVAGASCRGKHVRELGRSRAVADVVVTNQDLRPPRVHVLVKCKVAIEHFLKVESVRNVPAAGDLSVKVRVLERMRKVFDIRHVELIELLVIVRRCEHVVNSLRVRCVPVQLPIELKKMEEGNVRNALSREESRFPIRTLMS